MIRGIDAKDWARAANAAAFDSVAPVFQRLEDELAGKDYLVGSYSIDNIAFTPNLARQIVLGVGLPEKYSRTRAWLPGSCSAQFISRSRRTCRSTEPCSESDTHIALA